MSKAADTFDLIFRPRKYHERMDRKNLTVTSGKKRTTVYSLSGKEEMNAKQLLAPDGANTAPLSYMTIHDGGKDLYYAGFYMEHNLSEPTVACQYKALFSFRGVDSCVSVEPLLEGSSKIVNRRVNMLEAERIAAKDDINRAREVNLKLADVQELGAEIDSGHETLYNAYFCFLMRRDSLSELKRDAEEFVAYAASMNITLKSTYAAAPEAFHTLFPFNKRYRMEPFKGTTLTEPFKKQVMTTASLSTIYSHTSSEYFHEKGALLGYYLSDRMPFVFDLYDKSHFSYGMIICGETGYGKSASMKIMDSRFINRGYSVVSIDYQLNGKGGEYSIPCRSNGGVNYVIGAGEGDKLNLFEISTDSDRDPDTGIITETLRLWDKQIELTNIILSIAMSSAVEDRAAYDAALVDYMNEIILDTVGEIYKAAGLEEGNPSSLYVAENEPGKISSKRVKKQLPRMKDFYMELLRQERCHREETLKREAFAILKGKLKNWVRELYYCPACLTEFSGEEFKNLPFGEDGKRRVHRHKTKDGTVKDIYVEEIAGSQAYFDYPSNITLEDNLPWYNFDLSQAPETVRPVLVLVAMNYIMENFVKRNSVDPGKAKHIIFVTDEFHKVMSSMTQGVLKAYVALYRTARKHYVAPVIITQSINDIAEQPESKYIMESTAVYMLFRHLNTAASSLGKDGIGLTESQVESVMGLGGEKDEPRPGECCVFDRSTRQVSFIRFKYMPEVEGLMVETNTQKRAELMRRLGVSDGGI